MNTVSRLEQIVGRSRLLTQLEDLLPYSFDATPVLNQLPQAVVFTRTADEVVAVLKLANETKTPIVTRGSGTGLSGGSVPVAGCVVLCTIQMNQILALDPANLSAIIAAKIIPCTPEFLDQITIGCVEGYAKIGLPTDAEAILLIETDGHPAAVAEEAQAMESLAHGHGARTVLVAQTVEEATRLATARRTAFSALARVAPTTILEDVTVPRSELVKMVRSSRRPGKNIKLRSRHSDTWVMETFIQRFLRTKRIRKRCIESKAR